MQEIRTEGFHHPARLAVQNVFRQTLCIRHDAELFHQLCFEHGVAEAFLYAVLQVDITASKEGHGFAVGLLSGQYHLFLQAEGAAQVEQLLEFLAFANDVVREAHPFGF